jgi:hypothetical protein
MDADASHDPAVLHALVAIVEHGADLAIGPVRVPRGRTIDRPPDRGTRSRWGNRYAAVVLGLAVNDATAGCGRTRPTPSAGSTSRPWGGRLRFQVEMTHRLVRAGGKIVEFPSRSASGPPVSGSCRNGIIAADASTRRLLSIRHRELERFAHDDPIAGLGVRSVAE